MANSFELRENARQQHMKERPEPMPPETPGVPAGRAALKLETRKRRKQTYTVYLDKELMGRVQRLAKQKDVATSVVIETCVKMSLEQLE